MKLLLTSNGICNDSIKKALLDLLGKPFSETTIVFIPTAMNVSTGDKTWFINDLLNLKQLGLKMLDIVDISALPKKVWLSRLEKADVLFFCGGNTTHLIRWIDESGLKLLLSDFLKDKIYVGISAGSIVTNPTLAFSSEDKKLYYEEVFGYKNEDGLSLVGFYIRPHLNNPHFPKVTKTNIEEMSKNFKESIYAIDDETAIKINGDKVEVVSEGEYFIFNQK